MDAIILASSSPRRRELLSMTGIPFEVLPGEVDEGSVEFDGTPSEKAEMLARLKACTVAEKVKKGLVLGADTIVVCDGRVFGKPMDDNDARRMLETLSGREHLVITGVALVNAENREIRTGHEITRVRFSRLNKREIEAYIATGEHMDKAGAYAVQGKGAFFVEGIEGCYSNVVGLPLKKLYNMLFEFGVSVWDWLMQKEKY
ncbi:MAG: Maf family protein [Bacillota bacterium]